MALSSPITWEIRPTGSDTNSGGFKTGASGTDWSQQTSPQYSVTDGVTAGSTTITSATAAFGTDVVGNIIYVQGGTGSVAAGWYEITSRTNATTIVVDRATGLTAGTGVTLHIGGALLSPGVAAAASVTSNNFYVKAGTYSCSSSSNVASGRVTTGQQQYWEGYNATRGDGGTKPIFQASGSTYTLFSIASGTLVKNISFDGNSGAGKTAIVGATMTGSGLTGLWNCSAINCATAGIQCGSAGTAMVESCYASNCGIGFATGSGSWLGSFFFCVASGCTTGFSSTGGSFSFCIATGGTTGFALGGDGAAHNCVAYNAGTTGISVSGVVPVFLFNCIVSTCPTGYVVNSATVRSSCAGYNNTTGTSGTASSDTGFVTCSVDPFASAAGNNFAPNTSAGGGASLRAAATPATWPGLSSTGYLDVGAVQHQDSGFIVVNRRRVVR